MRSTDVIDSGPYTVRIVNPFLAVGAIFFIVAVLPAAMLSFYRGKFWSTQAWFIGIEGEYTDLVALEKTLFGFGESRLKWSPYSSTQLRHARRNASERLRNAECEGLPPASDKLPEMAIVRQYILQGRLVEQAQMAPTSLLPAVSAAHATSNHGETPLAHEQGTQLPNPSSQPNLASAPPPSPPPIPAANYGDCSTSSTAITSRQSSQSPTPASSHNGQGGRPQIDPDRIFTLVDTLSMTVMTFRAVLVCGHEGGAQRALLCSYDFRTQTFHRETVLRMQSNVLNRMERVEKFGFSIESMPLVPRD